MKLHSNVFAFNLLQLFADFIEDSVNNFISFYINYLVLFFSEEIHNELKILLSNIKI